MNKFILDFFAPVKVLAQGFTLSIENTGYVEVLGIKSFTFDSTTTDADTTCFDDEGIKTHLPASKSRSVTVEGFFLEDQTTGDRDPGQVLIETLSDLMGVDGIGLFQLETPFGSTYTFSASAIVSGIGGGNEDATNWKVELRISGAVVLV